MTLFELLHNNENAVSVVEVWTSGWKYLGLYSFKIDGKKCILSLGNDPDSIIEFDGEDNVARVAGKFGVGRYFLQFYEMKQIVL